MSRNPRTKQKREASAARSAARRALIAQQAALRAEAIAEEQAPGVQRRAVAAPLTREQLLDWRIATELARDGNTTFREQMFEESYRERYQQWVLGGRQGRQPRLAGINAERAIAVRAAVDAVPIPSPAVIREPLAVPDIKRGGYRRSDPLRNLASKGAGGIATIHLAAATRFSCDYEVGVCGAGGSGGDLERVDGSGAVGASERSLVAIGRYRAACDSMVPAHRSITQWISIHRWPVTECMKVAGIGYEKAMDYLLGGLDCLVDFYFPGRPVDTARIVAAIVDPQVLDIPQERLGRARKISA